MIDWLACAFVRVIGGVLCRLSPSVAVRIGQGLGALAYWLQPTRTRIGILNLRAAFPGQRSPPEARRIIRACYQHMGAGLVELLRLPVMDRAYLDRYITIKDLDRFERAVASGRPLIFLTGHYGNWELYSIVSALLGSPVVALARAQEKLPRLYRLLVSYRESTGCTIIHKGGAIKQLIAALRARRPVAIVGDQASRQGIFVEFFGRPALFATGPFRLAREHGAVMVPTFIHRLRGPFHRIIIEPPIELDRGVPAAEVIRQGIERFAAALARHVEEDPCQWLWMHKRWKHSPARRVLVLSDGKAGHVRQSLAVVEVLRQARPALSHEVVEIRYRSRLSRLLATLWSWWAPRGLGVEWCLRWTLSRESAAALLSRTADVIISCGASTAPANLLWAAENRAKAVVLMNPSPLPLRRFHLVIAPRHDRLPRRANVVQIPGAFAPVMDEQRLRDARDRLRSHPRFREARTAHPIAGGALSRAGAQAIQERAGRSAGPSLDAYGQADACRQRIAVFLGGDTARHALSLPFAESLMAQVLAACEVIDGECLVTTSRRTPEAVEQRLSDGVDAHPRCRLLLRASRDPIAGTMEGMLGEADVAVVTGESISMVSEACASGRPVIVVELPVRRARGSLPRLQQVLCRGEPTKHQRCLQGLVERGHVQVVTVPELGAALKQVVARPHPAAGVLDHVAVVREALLKLV